MAEHERDDEWEDIEAVRPANQGQNLPGRNAVLNFLKTNPLKTTLTEKKDLPTWLNDVTAVLKDLQISQVIDDTIPRPPRHAVEARRWQTISIEVKAWLCSSVNQDITAQMKLTGEAINYADDFVRVLKETLRGEGTLTREEAWQEFHDEAAKIDAKASEYVAKVLRAFIKASSHGMEMQPLQALYMVMDRLQGSYNWPTGIIMLAIDDMDKDTYSMAEFQAICREMIIDLRDIESISMASTQTSQTKKKRNRRRPRHQQQDQQNRDGPKEE